MVDVKIFLKGDRLDSLPSEIPNKAQKFEFNAFDNLKLKVSELLKKKNANLKLR